MLTSASSSTSRQSRPAVSAKNQFPVSERLRRLTRAPNLSFKSPGSPLAFPSLFPLNRAPRLSILLAGVRQSAAAIPSIAGAREGFSASFWSPQVALLLVHLANPSPTSRSQKNRADRARPKSREEPWLHHRLHAAPRRTSRRRRLHHLPRDEPHL